jgi:tellurite methyltransferase
MIRTIDGFHLDEYNDWVAELSCLHNQHVRHRPPVWDRPWVTHTPGREEHIGSEIDCPLCDRAELPAGLNVARTAGPFDAASVPAALQRTHRVSAHTWGRLQVLDGSVFFTMETNPPVRRQLDAGDTQPIPPGTPHAVHVEGPVRFVIDFLVSPNRHQPLTTGDGPDPDA